MTISFIIIGKNISFTINRCIDSVFKTIVENNINNYEIIYIDSNSSDDSIKKAFVYKKVKIYKILKHPNAAIARNLGFNKSKGDILFFIDGDMEIISDTFKELYSLQNGLKYPFISGDWIDYKYSNDIIIEKKKYYNLNEDEYQFTTGGLFLINRDLWAKIGGMRTVFRRSQDLDLGLRLSKTGVPLLRVKEPLSIHHTIDYIDTNRYFKDLLNGNFLYQGLLYKYNIFNKYIYTKFLFKELTFFSLLLLSTWNLFSINPKLFFIYPMTLFLKFLYKKELFRNLPGYIIRFIIHDINLFISLFFFWPRPIKTNDYIKIK
tara:strand:+ start:9511 stop:10467 length:957 start_codon:yes stop_codon:yes gene_type:complete